MVEARVVDLERRVSDTEREVTALSIRNEYNVKAIESISEAFIKHQEKMAVVIGESITIALKPILIELKKGEQIMQSLADDIKDRPILTDCYSNTAAIESALGEIDKVKKSIKFITLIKEYPRIAALSVVGVLTVLYSAITYEWFGKIILALIKIAGI